MALIVGTDTYISLVDCDTYLTGHYPSTDTNIIAWNLLSDANCETYLRRAAVIIDRQQLQGFKVLTTQTLEFPRILYSQYPFSAVVSPIPFQDKNWIAQTVVPDNVKHAQCEIAYQLLQGTPKRVELQRQGVKSIGLGKLSESYKGGQNTIVSEEAKELLQPYINKSFRIC